MGLGSQFRSWYCRKMQYTRPMRLHFDDGVVADTPKILIRQSKLRLRTVFQKFMLKISCDFCSKNGDFLRLCIDVSAK